MSINTDQTEPSSGHSPSALFADFHLDPKILKAVAEQGYTQATPIQAKAIPVVLEGRDVMGAAQTGTGKTAAFTLPIIQKLLPNANASTSPARLVLLRNGGIEPITIAPGVDEDEVTAVGRAQGVIQNTADMVGLLARAKAEAVAKRPEAAGAVCGEAADHLADATVS